MENPQRTVAYVSALADRQMELKALLANILSGTQLCVLEIGCGHGHFLTAYAATYPARVCLGLDIISDRIDRANRKKNRARLSNLNFVHANADDILATLPNQLRFSDVFVLFPDPWPKRRHHKNRLIQDEFLAKLAPLMGQGARLFFRTDDLAYFTAATAVLGQHAAWEIIEGPWAFEFETVFQQRANGYFSLVARPKAGG